MSSPRTRSGDGIAGRQHENRNLAAACAQLLANLPAVHPRHHQVQKQQVEDLLLGQRQAAPPVRLPLDRVPGIFQAPTDKPCDARLILDQ